MKIVKYIFVLSAFLFHIGCNDAEAKVKQQPVYVFGFSASFTDSIVYFTNVQKLDSAWIETKGDYLLNSDEYSRQLKNYFASKMSQMNRTCIIFCKPKKKDLEKLYVKMKRQYVGKEKQTFEVKYLNDTDFSFSEVNIDWTAKDDK